MTSAARRGLDLGLAALALLVAVVTLTPAGSGGWAWGDPGTELRWYLTGLDDPSTAGQLVGNLVLLAPVAVLAVARWPGLRSAGRLAATSLAVGAGIETLQWLLPLGRVVSPVDASRTRSAPSSPGVPWPWPSVGPRPVPRRSSG